MLMVRIQGDDTWNPLAHGHCWRLAVPSEAGASHCNCSLISLTSCYLSPFSPIPSSELLLNYLHIFSA